MSGLSRYIFATRFPAAMSIYCIDFPEISFRGYRLLV
jgi:hypothetical protein